MMYPGKNLHTESYNPSGAVKMSSGSLATRGMCTRFTYQYKFDSTFGLSCLGVWLDSNFVSVTVVFLINAQRG